MGNGQGVESSESYKTAIRHFHKGSHVGTKEGPQVGRSPTTPNSMDLVCPTAEEEPVFRGSTGEDMDVKPWKIPMNINMTMSTEPVLKQKPPEVQWSLPEVISPTMKPIVFDKDPKPEASAAHVTDRSKDIDSNPKNKLSGDGIKGAGPLLPPVLGFSCVRFPVRRPLYPARLDSVSTQVTEPPRIGFGGNHISCEEQSKDQEGTLVNPTLMATDTSATSQGGSLADSKIPVSEALPNLIQSSNHILTPIESTKALPLVSATSSTLEATREPSSIELPIKSPFKDGKRTQKTADTHGTTKTTPVKAKTVSTTQFLPYSVPTNTPEEAEVKSPTSFSYADALKKSIQSPQQGRAPKVLGKNEQDLKTQQKLIGRCRTTSATTKGIFSSNVKQNNAQQSSRNPKMDNSKNVRKPRNPSGPPTSPFKGNNLQPRFPWTSPHSNAKDVSWNVVTFQGFPSNNPNHFSKNTSPRKRQEQAKSRSTKKDKVYQSYTIQRRSKSGKVCDMTSMSTLKEPVKSKADVSVQPEDASLRSLESTRVEMPSSENITLVNSDTSVDTERSEQIGKCETTDQIPEVKLDVSQPMPPSEGTETSAEEHGDTHDLGNSRSSVQITETSQDPNFDDQVPDQPLVILENEAPSAPTPTPEVIHNIVSVEKENPVTDVAPNPQPSRRWNEFYVDNLCTMKCMCRHRPGKLPPNVVSWFSVAENKLAEPVWIATLKLASSLVTGTRLLLDHHSSHVPDISSLAPKER